jgi:hypothetical protein
MADHCPRDSGGFCRLALMAGACGATPPGEPAGKVRCPASEDEAHARLVAAAKRWAAFTAKRHGA